MYKKSHLKKSLMHVDEVIWHGYHRGTIGNFALMLQMRKVIRKVVGAGGRFDFFLDSDLHIINLIYCFLSKQRVHLFSKRVFLRTYRV